MSRQGKWAVSCCLAFVLLAGLLICQGGRFFRGQKEGTVFPMVEISFRLPEKDPAPFSRELWGWIENKSGGGIWIPAFFDGKANWKLRYSPRSKGQYRVRIFSGDTVRSPQGVIDLAPESFTVSGEARGEGLVMIDPGHPQNFKREDGSSYFPLGLNIGWDMGPQGDVIAFLERLAAAGGNWSRIWMCHWDDKNLDWPQGKKIPLGEMDAAAALKWDHIVAAADRLQIPFQMVLQHHGQYSSDTDAAWKENPWNRANGGFLDRAEDFFTDPQARLLTKHKYRYIVARYGYSPSVMAWELFNEVEFTDAGKTTEGQLAILEWHEEMAGYLRLIDPYHHLITTSALSLKSPVWRVADFYQQHSYPPDPSSGAGGFDVNPGALAKPIFYGEMGSMDPGGQTPGDGGRVLRDILWNSIFAGAGAGAQYWSWDRADEEGLYPLITAVTRFAKMAGLGQGFWRGIPSSVSTPGKTDLVFGPGQRWDSVADPQLILPADGMGKSFGTRFSATLRPRRGSGEREGSDSVTFYVKMEKPGRWEITVNEVSREGARLEMEVDGKILATKVWTSVGESGRVGELPLILGVDLPEGTQKLRVKSSGPDYFQISCVRLKDYVAELAARAMTNDRKTVAWIYRQSGGAGSRLEERTKPPVSGVVHLEGLMDGNYHVLWWDTSQALTMKEEQLTVSGGKVDLTTPPVYSAVAVLLERQ